jgi:hypothetical protein
LLQVIYFCDYVLGFRAEWEISPRWEETRTPNFRIRSQMKCARYPLVCISPTYSSDRCRLEYEKWISGGRPESGISLHWFSAFRVADCVGYDLFVLHSDAWSTTAAARPQLLSPLQNVAISEHAGVLGQCRGTPLALTLFSFSFSCLTCCYFRC